MILNSRLRVELARVVKALDCSLDDIVAGSRLKTIVQHRQAVCYILRMNTGASFPELGIVMQRDHTTIMSSCLAFAKALEADMIWATDLLTAGRSCYKKSEPVDSRHGLVMALCERAFERAVSEAV